MWPRCASHPPASIEVGLFTGEPLLKAGVFKADPQERIEALMRISPQLVRDEASDLVGLLDGGQAGNLGIDGVLGAITHDERAERAALG